MKKLALAALTSAIVAAPFAVQAESTTINGAIVGSAATARLDFTITVPAVLFLRVGVGSGVGAPDNTTVNGLAFTVPATNLGDGTVIAGTGGDVAAGAVTVRVLSNVGAGGVSLNSSVSGQLLNAAGDVIPWSQIAVAAAADPAPVTGYTNTGIAHPAFNLAVAGGSGTPTVLAAASKVVRQQGKWTFTYLTANPVPGGTYGSTVANNGRVTYTATQL